MNRFLLPLLLPVIFSACTTATFKVQSQPLQSEVFVENPKTGAKKSLGKTPLDMSISAVKETVGEDIMAGEFFTVDIEKPGYISQRLTIPATRFGTLVTFLDVKMKEGEDKKEARVAKELLDHLFLAQKFAMLREYDRGQVEIDKIFAVVPDFSRALSMRGSIYYLQKNYPESAKWYEQALKSDPQAEDAIKMLAKVRVLQGGSPVAGTAKGK